MKQFKVGIITPTYNESQNLSLLIEQIYTVITANNICTLLLVVDDGSPDGTALLGKQLAQKYNSELFEIRVHERQGKQGLATAYLQGIEMIKDQVEFVCSMDADLSHKPEYLVDFLHLAQSQDLSLVIGSRYVKGGGVENWSWDRKLISRCGSIYARTILGTKVNDFTGGYNFYRTSFLEQFQPSKNIFATGYLFQIEMKHKMIQSGVKYAESPIIFPDRIFGVSKMTGKIIKEASVGVLKMRWNNSK